jgi:hypothetical protein
MDDIDLESIYLEQDGGLFTFLGGDYVYFWNQSELIKAGINVNDKSIIGKDAPSISDLNSKFNNKGVYRIKIGEKALELVQSSGLQYVGKRMGQIVGSSAGGIALSMAALPFLFVGKTADLVATKSGTLRNVLKDKTAFEITAGMSKEAFNDLIQLFKGGKKIDTIYLDKPFDGSNTDEILSKLHKIHQAEQKYSTTGKTVDPVIDTAITITIGKGFSKNKYKNINIFEPIINKMSTFSQSEDDYHKKYLKYKKKYLELKRLEQEQEGGLISFKSGDYVFFGPESVLKEVLENKPFTKGATAPSVSTINNLFDNKNIYRVKIGESDLELISSSGIKYAAGRIGKGLISTIALPLVPLAFVIGGISDANTDNWRGVTGATEFTGAVLSGIVGNTVFNKTSSNTKLLDDIKNGAQISKIKLEKNFDLAYITAILPILEKLSTKNKDDKVINSAIVINFKIGGKNTFKDFIKLDVPNKITK